VWELEREEKRARVVGGGERGVQYQQDVSVTSKSFVDDYDQIYVCVRARAFFRFENNI